MQTNKLRVRAHGTACVQNYERLEAGVNCFIGRDFKEVEPGRHAFVPNDQIVEVPARAEYLKALRDGDLDAADEATARAAGLKFEAPKSAAVTPDGTPKGGK